MSVLPFKSSYTKRRRFQFLVRYVKLRTLNNKEQVLFPCIGLYEKETGVPVFYPRFERWLFDLQKCEAQATNTLKKKSFALCAFLNYLLWETDCDTFQDLNQNHLMDFMVSYKRRPDGKERDPQGWIDGVSDVFHFLKNYIEANSSIMSFQISPDNLLTTTLVKVEGKNQKFLVEQPNRFSIKAPKKTNKKYRYLLHGYLDLLIYEAKKFDPMIALGIMLQSYAGLREGEIVNLTTSRIKKVYGGFGMISKLQIDLQDEACFSKHYAGKTEFGSIKKYRIQEVYPDFINAVLMQLNEHERMMQADGFSIDLNAPLFVNSRGDAMSVHVYKHRVRELFQKRFLPVLKKYCFQNGEWAKNAPYIEKYEKEYPGAHMLRHWFTMYLLQYTNLTHEEISKWRGDTNLESMEEYVHVNGEIIREYRNAVFVFQRSVMERIL